MVVVPLKTIYDQIEHEEQYLPITTTKEIVLNKNIEPYPRKRQLSEYNSEIDTLRKKTW